MLLALFPVAHILPPVRPTKHPHPVLLVILVLSFVNFTVRPLNFTPSVHLVVLPLPCVLAVLKPVVCAYVIK